MSYTLHPRLTPARLAFLRAVERDRLAPWAQAQATNDCLKLGWVEHLGVLDGRELTLSQLLVEFGAYNRWERIGFVLTDAGRAVLEQEGGT